MRIIEYLADRYDMSHCEPEAIRDLLAVIDDLLAVRAESVGRAAIIRAEARLAALIEAHEALPGIVTLLAEARAELERLKQPAPQPIGGSDDPT